MLCFILADDLQINIFKLVINSLYLKINIFEKDIFNF